MLCAVIVRTQFPTEAHASIAQIVASYAHGIDGTDTVLLVNSCARGTAISESDLDMAILVDEGLDTARMEAEWVRFANNDDQIQAFVERGPYSAVHIDFFSGQFEPQLWDDGGGPDDFEIEIGNRLQYSVPFDYMGPYFVQLQARWLPYYDDELRCDRLMMAKDACLLDLEFIPFYLKRKLYLQAFDRLYKAFKEYLQALFISKRTYPIAYNKWLHEQLELIDEEQLYSILLSILAMEDLTSSTLGKNAELLRQLESEIRT